jgi:ABC-2 type transport system permease protein
MVLAGMVLANLVEEKSNKIIEVLAAAIPMDAVFLGKLFAMLAVSWVGIVVWAAVGGAIWQAAGHSLSEYSAPALGWPAFIGLGMIYFSIGYLLIGSIFLALGSLASTVREVQTLSMPATMLQLLNFFFASYAIGQSAGAAPNPTVLAAMIVPFSSPFTMLAQAALRTMWWPHLIAIAWQLCWVAVLIRAGALLFRVRVMHSGPAGGPGKARWWPRWLRRTAG